MNEALRTQIKTLKFVEKQIASKAGAAKSYELLRARGLENTTRFAELVGWIVITVLDKNANKKRRRKSLRNEAYFPNRLDSVADEIEALNANPRFVPVASDHNDLPQVLRSYAGQLRGRLKILKRNGNERHEPTVQALICLRYFVETQTKRNASPAALGRILDAVLESATADLENPPFYNFEANLKKIPPQPLR